MVNRSCQLSNGVSVSCHSFCHSLRPRVPNHNPRGFIYGVGCPREVAASSFGILNLVHSRCFFGVLKKEPVAVSRVPAGSPLRGGDVAVYVFDINQPSLPTPIYSVRVSISVLWSFQLHISL